MFVFVGSLAGSRKLEFQYEHILPNLTGRKIPGGSRKLAELAGQRLRLKVLASYPDAAEPVAWAAGASEASTTAGPG